MKILQLGERVLPERELEVEVEYDEYAISQFPIVSYAVTGQHLDFTLAMKHTDCLAKEKCGVGDDSCGCVAEESAVASTCC